LQNRNRNLFPFLIAASALIHAGILLLSPSPYVQKAEPPPGEERLVMLNLLPPAPSRAASPEPVPLPKPVPAPVPVPVETVPEISPEPAREISAESAHSTVTENTVAAAFSPVSSRRPAREDTLSRYAGLIRSLIDQNKTYPSQSRRQEQEGIVLVRFVLSRGGSLIGEPALEKKSRYERLNAAALEAVKMAGPYPVFPEEIAEDEMSFSIAVSYSLRQ
jgi:protein TonB